MFTLIDFGGFAKAASVTPTPWDSSHDPSTPSGYEYYKLESAGDGEYHDPNNLIKITIKDGNTSVDFESEVPICMVYVKGGNNNMIDGQFKGYKYDYNPPVKADTDLYALSNQVGNRQQISHIAFYYLKPVEVQKAKVIVNKLKEVSGTPNVIAAPNVDFNLYKLDDNGQPVGEPMVRTTGDDGIARFNDLEPGDYKLVEVEAPQGYVKANDEYFTLAPSQEKTISILNKLIPVENPQVGSLTVIKTLESSEGRPGVGIEFILYKINEDRTETEAGRKVTGEDGKVTFTDLSPIYKYSLEEVNIPEGYEADPKLKDGSYSVTAGNTTIVSVVNYKKEIEQQVGSIMILKKIKIGEKAPVAPENIEFTFNLLKDGKVIKTDKTNDNGVLVFDNLPVGEYVLEEVVTADYTTNLNSSNNKIIVIKNVTTAIEVINTLKEKPVDTEDPDEDDEELPATGSSSGQGILLTLAGALVILLGIRLRRIRQ